MNIGNIHLTRPTPGKTRQPSRLAIKGVMTLLALAGLCLATPAWAGNDSSHSGKGAGDDSRSSGMALAAFEDIYWRWAYGGLTAPTDSNSNAIVGGVVLMPIPATPGDGTPGSIDVTLKAEQPWMLPFWTLLGTSYTDGTPPDPFVGLDIFKTLDLNFQIDGRTVVSHHNLWEYFSKFTFDPPVPINSPPYLAVIWFEGVGILHEPLSPGQHTLKLDVKNTENLPSNFGGGIIEYHNTWNVTVQPGN